MKTAAAILLAALAALAAGRSAGAQDRLDVLLLGTGNPRPSLERFGPSILVSAGNERLLFDCGRGAVQRLFQHGIPLSDVRSLFLTHLHSDHTVGIPDFWLTGWIFGRSRPVRIWGPEGTTALVSNLEKAYAYDVHVRRDVDEKLPPEGAEMVARDIGEGRVFQRGRLRVTAFLVDHGPVRPALGYRVDFGPRSVVLSGDTRPSDNLVKFAKGTDVLVHEVLAPEVEERRAAGNLTPAQVRRIIEHHTTPEEAGKIFAAVHPKLAVYSHIVPSMATAADLVPATRKAYSGPLEVGEDGMRIEIGEKVRVFRYK
ncbi:MAG: MBL fold metallo-hydrolase [Thermoanaerobaculia bacterium]